MFGDFGYTMSQNKCERSANSYISGESVARQRRRIRATVSRHGADIPKM